MLSGLKRLRITEPGPQLSYNEGAHVDVYLDPCCLHQTHAERPCLTIYCP